MNASELAGRLEALLREDGPSALILHGDGNRFIQFARIDSGLHMECAGDEVIEVKLPAAGIKNRLLGMGFLPPDAAMPNYARRTASGANETAREALNILASVYECPAETLKLEEIW